MQQYYLPEINSLENPVYMNQSFQAIACLGLTISLLAQIPAQPAMVNVLSVLIGLLSVASANLEIFFLEPPARPVLQTALIVLKTKQYAKYARMATFQKTTNALLVLGILLQNASAVKPSIVLPVTLQTHQNAAPVLPDSLSKGQVIAISAHMVTSVSAMTVRSAANPARPA
uniref:Transmembrane domain-containing protein n=1 Tax=Spironucleus salmonicida TaxID=348837 RepID=V6LL76_9EUKA|eukprot:EST45385.1 Transmembrane domain-containing protein [Spironucleus salmonicida]